MLKDTRFSEDNLQIDYEYLRKNHYNNVDKIMKKRSNIKLVKLDNVHHGNIIEQEKLILQEILLWDNNNST